MAKSSKQVATRRLFDDGPLSFKSDVFFLDLQGYRGVKAFEKKLQARGGIIEQFFSTDVTCVITNADKTCANSQNKSPCKKSPKRRTTVNMPMNRARAILSKAKQKQQASSNSKKDVITTARGFGIVVKHVDDVVAELKRKESAFVAVNAPTKVSRGNTRSAKESCNVRNLKSPFLKVEDQTRNYLPLTKELKIWPKVHFDSLPPDSPFEPVKKKARRAKSRLTARSTSSKRQGMNCETAKATGHLPTGLKVGYCELCDVNYRGLKQHLRGIKHWENAANSLAFKGLDEAIKQGTSFEKYLSNVRRNNRITQRKVPPRSPRTPGRKDDTSARNTLLRKITPLKVMFSSPTKYAVMKTSKDPKGKLEVNEIGNDEVMITKALKRRRADGLSVVELDDLAVKIRRSTRLLRRASTEKNGFAFVEFPTYKAASGADLYGERKKRRKIIIKKYGAIHGKIRVNTRVMDVKDQCGLADFECPMYLDASED